MHLPMARKSTFTLDCFYEDVGPQIAFPGYTFGDRWNGFATPGFTKAEAERVAEALNRLHANDGFMAGKATPYAWYDAERDMFVNFYDDGYYDEEAEENQELDEWPGQTFEIDGIPTKLYSIGAYCWTWWELEADEDDDEDQPYQ